MAFGGRYPQKGTELFPAPGNPATVAVRGLNPHTPEGAAILDLVMPAAQSFFAKQAHNYSLSVSAYQKTSMRTEAGDVVTVSFNGADTGVLISVAPRGVSLPEEREVPAKAVFLLGVSPVEEDYPVLDTLLAALPGAAPSEVWSVNPATVLGEDEEVTSPDDIVGAYGRDGGIISYDSAHAVSWEGFDVFNLGVQIADLRLLGVQDDVYTNPAIIAATVAYGVVVLVVAWREPGGVLTDGDHPGGFKMFAVDAVPPEGTLNSGTTLLAETTYPSSYRLSYKDRDMTYTVSTSPDRSRLVLITRGAVYDALILKPVDSTVPDAVATVTVTNTAQARSGGTFSRSSELDVNYTHTDGAEYPYTWVNPVTGEEVDRIATPFVEVTTHKATAMGSYPAVSFTHHYSCLWSSDTGHEFEFIDIEKSVTGYTVAHEADFTHTVNNPGNDTAMTTTMEGSASYGGYSQVTEIRLLVPGADPHVLQRGVTSAPSMAAEIIEIPANSWPVTGYIWEFSEAYDGTVRTEDVGTVKPLGGAIQYGCAQAPSYVDTSSLIRVQVGVTEEADIYDPDTDEYGTILSPNGKALMFSGIAVDGADPDKGFVLPFNLNQTWVDWAVNPYWATQSPSEEPMFWVTSMEDPRYTAYHRGNIIYAVPPNGDGATYNVNPGGDSVTGVFGVYTYVEGFDEAPLTFITPGVLEVLLGPSPESEIQWDLEGQALGPISAYVLGTGTR